MFLLIKVPKFVVGWQCQHVVQPTSMGSCVHSDWVSFCEVSSPYWSKNMLRTANPSITLTNLPINRTALWFNWLKLPGNHWISNRITQSSNQSIRSNKCHELSAGRWLPTQPLAMGQDDGRLADLERSQNSMESVGDTNQICRTTQGGKARKCLEISQSSTCRRYCPHQALSESCSDEKGSCPRTSTIS